MEINDIISSKRRIVQERIEKSFGVDIEKARVAGDISSDGKKVWTEYAPGKFDWRVIKKKEGKEKTTSKVPSGMRLQDEDSWVEIYDKNGKKIKEEFFADLGFDPDEKWNEKDGNYDIKGGGKMVVPKEGNEREEDEEDESIKRFEQYGEEISQQIKDDKERKERLSRVNDKKLKAWKDRNKKKEKRKAKAQKDVIAALEADQGGLLDDEDSKKKIEAIKQAAAEFVEKNPDLNLTIEDWETIVDGSEVEDYEDYEGFEKLNDCIESYF